MRLTRGAELTIDEEKDEDFMRVMTEALRERRTGEIVRLEVSAQEPWAATLAQRLGLKEEAIIVNPSWIDLKTVSQLAFQPGFDNVKQPVWERRAVPECDRATYVWQVLRVKNVHVFHPYQTFDAVVQFPEAAAQERDVLDIKKTVYRTDADSAVVRAQE